MKTTHIVRSLGISLAAACMFMQAPALAQSAGGGGIGGTGGGPGDGPDCRCTAAGGGVSDLGGLVGAAAIGACLWRINRRRNNSV